MLSLLLLLTGAAAAATSARIGIDAGAVREDLLVPLGFGGGGLHLGGAWSARVGSGLLDLRANVGLRLLSTHYGQIAISGSHSLDARWLLPVAPSIGIGPAFVWDARMNYLESWDDAHGYWFGNQWLGPAARFVDDPGGRRPKELAIALGLVGAAGRPDDAMRLEKQDPLKRVSYWFTGPVQNERWVSIATCQAVRLDAMLGADEDHRWSYGLDTHFVRTTEPVIAVDLGATLWAGFRWGYR